MFRKFLSSINYLFSRLFIDISVQGSTFDVKLVPESWLIFGKVVSRNYKTRCERHWCMHRSHGILSIYWFEEQKYGTLGENWIL